MVPQASLLLDMLTIAGAWQRCYTPPPHASDDPWFPTEVFQFVNRFSKCNGTFQFASDLCTMLGIAGLAPSR